MSNRLESDPSNPTQSSSTPQLGHGSTDSTLPSVSATQSKKRKAMRPRSEVWDHFTKFEIGNDKMARCNYCQKTFHCDPSRNGTSALKNHMLSCKKFSRGDGLNQTKLVLHVSGDGDASLTGWKFDQDVSRKMLARMIITDELPFKFVEHEGFKNFMGSVCPRFQIPSRTTISRDCYSLYIEEKSNLKQMLKRSCQRVCLTTDTWTSEQKINCMCLTAHFIDNDWRLHKKILNFCPITSHRGDAIGSIIEKCLHEWGIDKVFTITVDNASSNDVAIASLRDKMMGWGQFIAKGKFLHMRCIAHIINLIVVDGLKEMHASINCIRGAVKHVRQSPARLAKFKEAVEMERIQSKKMLCLNVSTRWNSTYLMLDTTEKFERAFIRYGMLDPMYKFDLEMGDGFPTSEDWKNVRRFIKFLGHFYDLTLRISGSLYVTSTSLFHEICEVHCLLKQWQADKEDVDLRLMANRMKEKFDKYWGPSDKVNLLIYVAVVCDPRYKLDYVEFALENMLDGELGKSMGKRVRDTTYDLFEEYDKLLYPQSGEVKDTNDTEPEELPPQKELIMSPMYKQHKSQVGSKKNKSELDKYLSEDNESDTCKNFDILNWWKVNSLRFPVLSHMARDILVIPISTVASESAFSTGGRVLDPYRSSLTPKIVQALICAADWLKTSKQQCGIAEELEIIENIDNDLMKVAVEPLMNLL